MKKIKHHFLCTSLALSAIGITGCVAVPQASETMVATNASNTPLQVIRYQPQGGGQNYRYAPATVGANNSVPDFSTLTIQQQGDK